MKKVKSNKRKFLTILSGLSLTTVTAGAVLVACTPENWDNSISINIADPDNERWVTAQRLFEKNIKNETLNIFEEGQSEFEFQAKTTITKNQEEQNNRIANAISKKAKAIIIGAINDTAAKAVNDASSKSIPVIAYDRLINGTSRYSWYVTFDNQKVGELQGLEIVNTFALNNYMDELVTAGINVSGEEGEEVSSGFSETATANDVKTFFQRGDVKAKPIPDRNVVVAMAGSPSDNNAKYFFLGAASMLNAVNEGRTAAEKPLLNLQGDRKFSYSQADFESIATNNWDYTEAGNSFETQLAKPDVTSSSLLAVLAPNDGMANAAISKINSNQSFGTIFWQNNATKIEVAVTGQDANSLSVGTSGLIATNRQSMTIWKPDSLSVKIALIIAKILAVRPNSTPAQVEKILNDNWAKVQEQANIQASPWRLDSSFYIPTGATKAVNTIVLSPIVIKKSNLNVIVPAQKI